ncbi:hypothetical protein AYI69_g6794 [Smittium culicis]|uniref:Secreted protein n=1 Tax=Smittium culicis TaxID=133412 RepID=A0A1R1XWF9_9FUNG|nr:hypothetical protein AYI69_g6794 [Smittium culicis]
MAEANSVSAMYLLITLPLASSCCTFFAPASWHLLALNQIQQIVAPVNLQSQLLSAASPGINIKKPLGKIISFNDLFIHAC